MLITEIKSVKYFQGSLMFNRHNNNNSQLTIVKKLFPSLKKINKY